MNDKIKNYQTVDTLGKSNVDLVIKVYNGAIANLKAAAEHYDSNQRPLAYADLEKTKKFLVHLYTTLDEEKGGEIAEKLARLYAYIIEQINYVQATGEKSRLDDIILILNNVKDGWVELAGQRGSGRSITGQEPPKDQPPVNIKISI